ncbi:MAG: rhodanese-like domain-containing protein [Thermodesulfobacteriota bacterium]
MKKACYVLGTLLVAGWATMVAAADAPAPAEPPTRQAEKAYLAELKKAIPADRVKTVDDLRATWDAVQAGTSKAVIVDIRTRDEFDSGHIRGANNVDSGHAYSIPGIWPDPETELWVFCRTQHRASYFVSTLYGYGYKNVYLVNGGIKEWAEKGNPLVSEYLGEIRVVKYDKRVQEKYDYREGH